MIKIEFSNLKEAISITHHFYVEVWSSMVEVYWTLDDTIFMFILMFAIFIRTISSKENCPSLVRVRVKVSFRMGGEAAIFLGGNCSRTSLNISRTDGRNVDTSCTSCRTFEYSNALNISRIMNISGFQICQGS